MRLRSCRTVAVLLCFCELLSAQALSIRTEELPRAIKGAPYHAELTTAVSGRCPNGDVRLTVGPGKLPKGLELFSFGIQGTPRQMGRFRFTLRAANGCAADTKTFDLEVTGKPILLVFPANLVFECHAGSEAPPEEIIRVQGSWPNLAYSIDTSPAPWLKMEPFAGKTPDSESVLTGDRVRVGVDPAKLAPGMYHATLKFYASGSENAPTVEVTLKVLKAE
jgi:hypothetical protein